MKKVSSTSLLQLHMSCVPKNVVGFKVGLKIYCRERHIAMNPLQKGPPRFEHTHPIDFGVSEAVQQVLSYVFSCAIMGVLVS